MKWPWPWRRSTRRRLEDRQRRAELADARRRLADADRTEPLVRSVVDQLRRIREENHFAELIAASFREHR